MTPDVMQPNLRDATLDIFLLQASEKAALRSKLPAWPSASLRVLATVDRKL